MIYIFGTEHDIQRGISGKRRWTDRHFQEMTDELLLTIRKYSIKIVFEEMHTTITDGKKTLCEKLCEDLCIPVRLIDLSAAEREWFAIDGWLELAKIDEHASAWWNDIEREDEGGRGRIDEDPELQKITELIQQVRERVWIARIMKRSIFPALFLCGANHVEPLNRLLREFEIECSVAQRDYPDAPM